MILSFRLILASNCRLLGINQAAISHSEAFFPRAGQWNLNGWVGVAPRVWDYAWLLAICCRLLARCCVDLLVIQLLIKPSSILLKHYVAGVSYEWNVFTFLQVLNNKLNDLHINKHNNICVDVRDLANIKKLTQYTTATELHFEHRKSLNKLTQYTVVIRLHSVQTKWNVVWFYGAL